MLARTEELAMSDAIAERKRLAPHGPVGHAIVLGSIGTLLATLGAVGAMGRDLGPMWMPIALVITALPTTWYGAHLYANRKP
jgi:hypothetical protein